MRIKSVVIVLSLLLLGIVAYFFVIGKDEAERSTTVLTEKEKRELAEFEEQIRLDSLSFAARYKTHSSFNRYHHHNKEAYPVERFAFDPNTADSVTFLRLGLKPWQAYSALQYRRHGGRWRKPEAFLNLYGLTERQGRELLPYIKIQKNAEELVWEEQKKRRDSLRSTMPQKFPSGTVVSLNSADTTMLKRIPGIGSYYAGKIVRYRERLGGFVSTEQLREIDGLPPHIEAWFTIDEPVKTTKLRINHSDFKTLVRHPYLNYEQVKVITNQIRLRGPLKSFDDLKLSGEFAEKDIERLLPYIYRLSVISPGYSP